MESLKRKFEILFNKLKEIIIVVLHYFRNKRMKSEIYFLPHKQFANNETSLPFQYKREI